MDTIANTIRFKARVTSTANQLQIEYVAQNIGGQPVYLVDMAVVVDPKGIATVESARPRVEFVSPDTALVSSKLFPLPPGTLTAAPLSAYTNRLPPGEMKQGVILLALPLRDYRAPRSARTREVACKNVQFVLGVVPENQLLQADEQQISGTPAWRLSAAAWTLQQEVTFAASLQPPIPLTIAD